MAEQLIISVSGMRGIVGENLTEQVAVEYGRAFGAFLKDSRPASQATDKKKKLSVCIGRDSRPSGPMLVSAVAVEQFYAVIWCRVMRSCNNYSTVAT